MLRRGQQQLMEGLTTLSNTVASSNKTLMDSVTTLSNTVASSNKTLTDALASNLKMQEANHKELCSLFADSPAGVERVAVSLAEAGNAQRPSGEPPGEPASFTLGQP